MMFHNTEKTETRHGNVPQVSFVAGNVHISLLEEQSSTGSTLLSA